jgi:DNA invertase Pin-like site-specific DNA recombinase
VRVIGYVRVSTEEQADSGAGLEAQRAAIAAEAERRGWQLVEVYEDAGASGKSLKRPGLAEALAAVERGDASAVIVAKLDRLSRSVHDFASVMERAQRRGWALVALDLGVDTTTPAGELVAHVMASVAQWERRVIGQRTAEALAVRRAQGVKLGRPRLMPPKVRTQIVRERKAGATLTSIAAKLNARGVPTAQGGKQWYPSTVAAALRAEGGAS